jgi:hypothetical protein
LIQRPASGIHHLFKMGEFLFKIRETFELENKGLIVEADIKFKDSGLKTGDEIELRPPDGQPLITYVKGIAMFNPSNPERLLSFSLTGNLSKKDVPTGTEVWSRP